MDEYLPSTTLRRIQRSASACNPAVDWCNQITHNNSNPSLHSYVIFPRQQQPVASFSCDFSSSESIHQELQNIFTPSRKLPSLNSSWYSNTGT
jgi:hypothetical protein